MQTVSYFNLASIGALVLGVLASFLQHPLVEKVTHLIANTFFQLFTWIVLPTIFLSIVSTIIQIKGFLEAKKLIATVLKYTVATTLCAAIIGLLVFLCMEPYLRHLQKTTKVCPSQSLFPHGASDIAPPSLTSSLMENPVLQVALLATILGLLLMRLPSFLSTPLKNFFQILFQSLLKVSTWLVKITPIAVFAFTVQFSQNIRIHRSGSKQLFVYGCMIIGANLLHGFVLLPALLKWKKISPLRAVRKMMPALLIAFFTRSSNASLPAALASAKNGLRVSDKIAQLCLPLCSIINMNGCAAFILITSLFVSFTQGVFYAPFELVVWVLVASLAAIGNASTPMGCYFLTIALLNSRSISLEIMGMILPLYFFFDMVETALNVWSDSCVTLIVDKEMKPSENYISA